MNEKVEIGVFLTDITEEATDAIVSSANNKGTFASNLRDGTIAAAIFDKGGPEIVK